MTQSVGSWCLLVTLALTLLLARVEAQAGPGAPAVGVVRVERQQTTEADEFIGRIRAVNRVALVARVTGFLEQQLFAEGSEVKKGDLLYQIEKPPFQAAVDGAPSDRRPNGGAASQRAGNLATRADSVEHAGRTAIQC
jgi:membrane fusion protein, multidrug efflux system